MLHLVLPPSCRPWLPALAWYLRQNLLTFLHSPKYTDSNSRNHFQVRLLFPTRTHVSPSPAHPDCDFSLDPCICGCVHEPMYTLARVF